MNILRTVSVEVDGKMEMVSFGTPDTSKELEQMFTLRYTEYTRRKYINPEKYPEGQERDVYDENGKSTYFIAMWKDKMIGTIRLIRDIPLPTELDFHFTEPQLISDIPKEKRLELGRFIIIPIDRENKKFLPRGLVMIVMFSTLLKYCQENKILGGYSFVKENLLKKLKRLKTPVHAILPYVQRYPKDGVLYNYFTQKENQVVPIVFRVDEFKNYLDKILSFKFIFEIHNNGIIMKNNLFTKSLKFFNMI